VLAKLVLWILPSGAISCNEDIIRQSSCCGFLLESRIQGLNLLAVRAPIAAILIFLAGD
jgi:hypothetical protein